MKTQNTTDVVMDGRLCIVTGANSGDSELMTAPVIPAQAGIPRLPGIPSPLWGQGQDEGSLLDTLTSRTYWAERLGPDT